MEIQIRITADEKALELSRNLGGLANYFMEALQTNAMEEHGIAVRNLAEPENQAVEVQTPVLPTATTKPIEPDPVHYEAPEPAPAVADQPADPAPTTEVVRAMAVAFAKHNGKEAMRLLLDKLETPNVSSLDEEGRRLAVRMMEEATHA